MKNELISAFYGKLQVAERGNCPRLGIYKVNQTFIGECYSKEALMAKCQWRLTEDNEYQEDFVVTIQLESFKLNATDEQLKVFDGELIGKEIVVDRADYVGGKFILKWHFLINKTGVERLNEMLRSNQEIDFGDEVDLDELDDYCDPCD